MAVTHPVDQPTIVHKIVEIPLSHLEPSPNNVRTVAPSRKADAQLKRSIEMHGLQKNLVVRPRPPGSDNTAERYQVTSGSRRFRALLALAKENILAPNCPIPCQIRRNDTDNETELSTAENVHTEPMHIADTITAFAKMNAEGLTTDAIANRFGLTERTVRQRLRLGTVATPILKAFRKDEISLGVLKAFAATNDPKRQRDVWKGLKGNRPHIRDWNVRQQINDSRLPSKSPLARFITRKTYEQAGGITTEDLFPQYHGETSTFWYENPALVRKLAQDKLERLAKKLVEPGWKWSLIIAEPESGFLFDYDRICPTPGKLSAKEKNELTRTRSRIAKLTDLKHPTKAHHAEYRRISRRVCELEQIPHTRATFTPEHQAHAGYIVTVERNGKAKWTKGLVRKEDREKAGIKASSRTERSSDSSPYRHAQLASQKHRETIRNQTGISLAISEHIRSERGAIIQRALAKDFEAAFDLAIFEMARTFDPSNLDQQALDLRLRDQTPTANPTNFESRPAPIEAKDDKALFDAIAKLPIHKKQTLFAQCVGRTLIPVLAYDENASHATESTVQRLAIDFAANYRPNAEDFWSKLPVKHLLAIARETLGEAWITRHAKAKKSEIVSHIAAAFGADDAKAGELEPAVRAAALQWIPPGFAAFDQVLQSAETGDEDASDDPLPAFLNE